MLHETSPGFKAAQTDELSSFTTSARTLSCSRMKMPAQVPQTVLLSIPISLSLLMSARSFSTTPHRRGGDRLADHARQVLRRPARRAVTCPGLIQAPQLRRLTEPL